MAFEADEWEGPNGYTKSFGKAASFYPAKETLIERHPDKRASSSDVAWKDDKTGVVLVWEVRGEFGGVLGVFIMRASGGHPDGKLKVEGLSTFTSQEMQFDSGGYLTCPEIQVDKS